MSACLDNMSGQFWFTDASNTAWLYIRLNSGQYLVYNSFWQYKVLRNLDRQDLKNGLQYNYGSFSDLADTLNNQSAAPASHNQLHLWSAIDKLTDLANQII